MARIREKNNERHGVAKEGEYVLKYNKFLRAVINLGAGICLSHFKLFCNYSQSAGCFQKMKIAQCGSTEYCSIAMRLDEISRRGELYQVRTHRRFDGRLYNVPNVMLTNDVVCELRMVI